ncbi:MAG: VanZ family protein [Chloroflexia bacterium]|nr:VanZ family protein [Chloroflexia bacterium]
MSNASHLILRPIARIAIAIGWMALIFLVSARGTVPRPPGLGPVVTSSLGHFSVYFVLAILVWWVLGGFGLGGRRRWLLAFALAVLYGVSDEWHQSFVPGRQPDPLDVAVDALGAACGLAVAAWAVRRWGGSNQERATAAESRRRNSPGIADTT